LSKHRVRMNEASALIKTGILPDRLLTGNDSLLTLDVGASNNNGIATAFSRKKEGDPFPKLIYQEEVCAGLSIDIHECLIDPQDLHSTNIDDKARLGLIYAQLYTVPKQEMLLYSKDMVI
jgi:hypothetical protein